MANPQHLADLNQVPAVNLLNERGTETEWNLYPCNFDEVTVERDDVVVAAASEVNNDKFDESLVGRSDATVNQTPAKPIVPTGRRPHG